MCLFIVLFITKYKKNKIKFLGIVKYMNIYKYCEEYENINEEINMI